MAGTPADDDARRERARTQRLGQGLLAWQRSTVGEQATSDALASLPVRRWSVLRGLRWPTDEPVGADHVVVGRGGVFVIDTKNWTGRVTVGDGVLRQAGQVRGVAGTAAAAEIVARLLERRTARAVWPVLCVSRDEPVAGVVDGVLVCSTWNVRELLLSRPRALSRRQRRAAVRELEEALRPARHGARRHRSTRPGSGRDSVVRDLARAGVLLVAFAAVVSRPDVVTDTVDWVGDRISALAE